MRLVRHGLSMLEPLLHLFQIAATRYPARYDLKRQEDVIWIASTSPDRMMSDTLVFLTDSWVKPIVRWWGELTPRGNMVHKGIEREDGVQDQLVLGSLKSSQDLRRT